MSASGGGLRKLDVGEITDTDDACLVWLPQISIFARGGVALRRVAAAAGVNDLRRSVSARRGSFRVKPIRNFHSCFSFLLFLIQRIRSMQRLFFLTHLLHIPSRIDRGKLPGDAV